jgi:hypothetical protein
MIYKVCMLHTTIELKSPTKEFKSTEINHVQTTQKLKLQPQKAI